MVGAKVFFTLSYMGGKIAQIWAGKELDEIKGFKMKNSGQLMYSNYNKFKTRIEKRFSEKDEETKAQDAMKILQQTGPVDNYKSAFEILEKDSNYNEPGLIVVYKASI